MLSSDLTVTTGCIGVLVAEVTWICINLKAQTFGILRPKKCGNFAIFWGKSFEFRVRKDPHLITNDFSGSNLPIYRIFMYNLSVVSVM